jgi:cyanate permease
MRRPVFTPPSEVHPSVRILVDEQRNFGWCLGAVTAPLAIAASLRSAGIGGFARGFAFFAGCAVVAIWVSAAGTTAFQPPRAAVCTDSTNTPCGRLALHAGLFQFLYVGTENSLSGWLPSYLSGLGWSARAAAAAQAGLWAAVLAGRLMAPFALRRAGARGWMLFSLMMALAGILLLISTPWRPAQLGGVGLAGLGLAAVFPTSVALYLERAGGRVVPATGFVFACGALGGATVPWATRPLRSKAQASAWRVWTSLRLRQSHGLTPRFASEIRRRTSPRIAP